MAHALGGILTVLLALACLTILVGSIVGIAAQAGQRDHLERGFWTSLLVGTGLVTVLNIAVRLV